MEKKEMSPELKSRIDSKIQENSMAETHEYTFECNELLRKYTVFSGVFSPAIFSPLWLTLEVLKQVKSGQKFLEIGCGCGVTSIEVALQIKDCEVFASDINEQAVKNTQYNIEKNNAKMIVKQSDLFNDLPSDKFDIIYWNFPFIESDFEFNTVLEKSFKDPGYRTLDRYFKEAGEWIKEGGYLLTSFSAGMGNSTHFFEIANKYQWKWETVASMGSNHWVTLYKFFK